MLIRQITSRIPLTRPFNVKSVRSWYSARYMGSESGAYDGDGKTTVQVLGEGEPHINLISAYSDQGFRLQNNLLIRGSILIFPTHIYSWAVRKAKDITPESLLIFDLIVPKLKIVVIGYGQSGEPYDPTLHAYFRNKGIGCEMLPTKHAISTYNFLACDSVHVGGAFIPMTDPVNMTTQDEMALHAKDRIYRNKFFPDYGHDREDAAYLRQRMDTIGPPGSEKFGGKKDDGSN